MARSTVVASGVAFSTFRPASAAVAYLFGR